MSVIGPFHLILLHSMTLMMVVVTAAIVMMMRLREE